YLELRQEMGYPLDRFNDGEAGLRRMVPPAIVKLVSDYWTDVDVHEEIDSFDRRKSSVSWGIPAKVNDRIIHRLHSENPAKTVRRRETVEVVGWDLHNFETFLVGDFHRISLLVQERVVGRLFDEVCRVPRASSC